MDKQKFCECINWCRTEQPFTDNHHIKCEHYNDKVWVIKVTRNNATMVDTDIRGVLEGMKEWGKGTYQVEITEMYQRELAALDK